MASGPDFQLIFADNPGALPASYDLASDISVQSIVARIDGAGAAGSFLPTLSLYTQDGHLIARVPSDVTYAVGDTGVVTWSPFLTRRVAATPATGAAVEAWSFTVSAFAITGGGMDRIAFTGNQNRNASGTTYDLDGSGNLEILSAGAYALHLKGDTFPVAGAGHSSLAHLMFDVTAGTVWGWSSKGPGMALEGNARWAIDIEDHNAVEIDAFGGLDLLAFVWLRTTDTFPVTIGSYASYEVDGLGTAGTANFKLTCVRLGDLFVF